MKMRRLSWIFLFVFTPAVHAEVLVLVHGFLGSDRSWLESGVIDVLHRNGHPLAGVYSPAGQSLHFVPLGEVKRDAVYTVNLPSTAPVLLQADWLAGYLGDIHRRHPDEAITLVGHSAGGVVARMTLVRHHPAGVTRFISIAAPHFGTWRANQALDAVSGGGLFGPAKRWNVKRRIGSHLYYTLKASRGVLHDLTPPRPGNLLFWLNAQTHPDIEYVSIIRIGTLYMPGDRIVRPFSQDMRLLRPIGKTSTAYRSAQGHLLSPQDGQVIANLLKQAKQRPIPEQEPVPTDNIWRDL